jgi:hypothetical protein
LSYVEEISLLRKRSVYMQKTLKLDSFSHPVQKNQFKMDQRP